MTKQEFNTYKFSIFTEVLFMGEWQNVREVWFDEYTIGLRQSGHLIKISEVEGIREGKTLQGN